MSGDPIWVRGLLAVHTTVGFGAFLLAPVALATMSQLFGNHVWLWLWPTAVRVPAIVVTTAYYKRKFAPRVPPPAMATA